MSSQRFVADIKKYAEKTKLGLEQAAREIVREVHFAIVLNTPVDTGRLVRNWRVIVNGKPNEVDPIESGARKSASRSRTNSEAAIDDAQRAIEKLKIGQRVQILNPVPYAIFVEEGTSRMAPVGMVKAAVVEFGDVLKRAKGSP